MKVKITPEKVFKPEDENFENLLQFELFSLEIIPVIFLSLKEDGTFEFLPVLSSGALCNETLEITEPDLQKRIKKMEFIQKTINYCTNGNFFYILKAEENGNWNIGLIFSHFLLQSWIKTPTQTDMLAPDLPELLEKDSQSTRSTNTEKKISSEIIVTSTTFTAPAPAPKPEIQIAQSNFYPATPKQLKFLKDLLRKCGLSEYAVEELTKSIDRSTATKAIDLIKEEKIDEAINLLQSGSKSQTQQFQQAQAHDRRTGNNNNNKLESYMPFYHNIDEPDSPDSQIEIPEEW